MKKLLDKNYTQLAILILLLIVLIILFVQMFGKANREGGYDFTSYLLSSKALLNNTNPYITNTPYPYIYPLFLAFILMPITFLPYSVNNILWFVINVSSFCFTVFLFLKTFYNDIPSKKVFIVIIFFIVVIIFNPIQIHLLNGQVNFIVLLFCTLFFYFYNKNNILSCLFLAFAISLKIVPLVLLLFLLIEKKYWSIILTVVFSFIYIFVFPYIFAGLKILDYYSYYLDNFILNSFSTNSAHNSGSMYFTLYGFITSILLNFKPFDIYLKIVSIFLVILPVVYFHYQLLKKNVSQRNLLLFSLYSLAIILISPSSQTHHLVFIIPSIFLIVINIYVKVYKENRLFIIYYLLVFTLFWLGNIFKYSPFIFITIMTLFTITFNVSQNMIRFTNEKI